MAEVQSGSENFLKAIEKYAEEQRNKIRFESESFKKQELEKSRTARDNYLEDKIPKEEALRTSRCFMTLLHASRVVWYHALV